MWWIGWCWRKAGRFPGQNTLHLPDCFLQWENLDQWMERWQFSWLLPGFSNCLYSCSQCHTSESVAIKKLDLFTLERRRWRRTLIANYSCKWTKITEKMETDCLVMVTNEIVKSKSHKLQQKQLSVFRVAKHWEQESKEDLSIRNSFCVTANYYVPEKGKSLQISLCKSQRG